MSKHNVNYVHYYVTYRTNKYTLPRKTVSESDSSFQVIVKCHQNIITVRVHHSTYYYQVTSIYDQQFISFYEYTQTDRQTDRQTQRQRQRQTDRHTDRHRQADRQTDTGRQRERQTDKQTHRQTDRQTDRHKGRQRGRQRERQTDKQTHRETDRQTDILTQTLLITIPAEEVNITANRTAL